jgi:hypothetical protein
LLRRLGKTQLRVAGKSMGVELNPLFQLEKLVYSVQETALISGRSTKTVYRQVDRGILEKAPTGLRTISITRASLKKMLAITD